MAALDSLFHHARIVDLTQRLGPSTVLWPGSTPFRATVVADFDTHGGYARELEVPEHAGTHLDAPIHFSAGAVSTGELEPERLIRPLVKLDVRDRVAGDPGYAVTAADILAIEARDGEIPRGVATAVHTGWDVYVDDPPRYRGTDEIPSFPGLATDAAALLVERGVVGVGIDTLGIDPGHETDFPAHRITLPAGLWHLEGLVGLADVPQRGGWLVAAPIPIVAGSGAPARVFAIVQT